MLPHPFRRLLPLAALAASLSAGDWPVAKGNLYFTGNNDELIVKNQYLKWLYQAENTVAYPTPSDGLLFFSDLEKRVYALDQESGRLRWRFDMKAASAQFGSAPGVPGKLKAPVVQGERLFLSDAQFLYALDKRKGTVLWARAALQEGDAKKFVIDGIYADPLVCGDRLVYGSRKNFMARALESGHVAWSNAGVSSWGAFPAYSGGLLFAGSRDFQKNTFSLVCLEASNGRTRWETPVPAPLAWYHPAAWNGCVYFATGNTLLSLSTENGSPMGRFAFEEPITSGPSFTDGKILLTLGGRKLAVVDAKDGRVLRLLDTGAVSSPSFSLVRDQVYLARSDLRPVGERELPFAVIRAYRFDDFQAPLWEFVPPFPGSPSQPAAEGGTLFVAAGNYVYAVGTYYDQRIVKGGSGHGGSNQDGAPASNLAGGGLPPPPDEGDPPPGQSALSPPVALEKARPGDQIECKDIYFEYNRAYLRRESLTVLDAMALQLRRNPGVRMEIQGHTDNRGDTAYNMALSQKRAEAVMEYLVKHGVHPDRLRAVGLGDTVPIAPNETEEGRARNRRTTFLVR